MKKFINLVVLLIVLLQFNILLNPLRKSETNISYEICSVTPIGTYKDEVRQFITKKGWDEYSIIESKHGYRIRYYTHDFSVGDSCIEACIGEYLNPLPTSVHVTWVFDEKDKLVEIFVNKCTDGP